MVFPPTKKSWKPGETLTSLTEIVDKEHKRLLARKSIIEKRKEEQERQLLEMVLSVLVIKKNDICMVTVKIGSNYSPKEPLKREGRLCRKIQV